MTSEMPTEQGEDMQGERGRMRGEGERRRREGKFPIPTDIDAQSGVRVAWCCGLRE